MAKAPAFQFFAGDRAMDLMGLDNEAVGAWTRAMMYLWTTGPAPEERLCNVAGKGWERVRFLFGSYEGGLGLEWMEELREKQRVFRENAAKNGARGGRPSKAKKGTLTEPKPKPNPKERVGSMKIEVLSTQKGKERASAHEADPPGLIWPKFAGPQCRAKWAEFIEYRVKEKRQRYKSLATEQKALDLAAKYFPTGPEFVAALDHTMARTWIFPVDPSQHRYPFASPTPDTTSRRPHGKYQQYSSLEQLAREVEQGAFGPIAGIHDTDPVPGTADQEEEPPAGDAVPAQPELGL